MWWLHLILLVLCLGHESPETPEALFRRTVASWQSAVSKNDWSPWYTFCDELWTRFATSSETRDRLDIVNAYEEGILIIEREIFQRGQGANPARDTTLSKLYTAYARTLANLDAKECPALATDPHTLLIGVGTVDKNSPTTHVCMENAENSLRNALSLDATNEEADEMIAEITGSGNTIHDRKPREFVAELFDSFADTFDEKLLKALEYKVPALIGGLAGKLSANYSAVLDAGCGTGLAGRYIRPLVPDGIIIGVDASQKMLDKARGCTLAAGCGLEISDDDDDEDEESSPLYDGLAAMDLEEMTIDSLSTTTNVAGLVSFDLIVAADVLVYFGKLDSLFRNFASISAQNGHLIFSCEFATDTEAPLGWRLLASGRFAHTKKHAVESAGAAGYVLSHYEEITPRTERGEPVRGHLFAFEFVVRSLEKTEL